MLPMVGDRKGMAKATSWDGWPARMSRIMGNRVERTSVCIEHSQVCRWGG